MSVQIKIDKDLLNLAKNERKGLVKALVIMGDTTQNEIKKTRRFIDRTQHLRTHILRDKVNESGLSVTVTAHVGKIGSKKDPPYANFLNDGTKFIKARRFMEEGLGKASPTFERVVVIELNKTM